MGRGEMRPSGAWDPNRRGRGMGGGVIRRMTWRRVSVKRTAAGQPRGVTPPGGVGPFRNLYLKERLTLGS